MGAYWCLAMLHTVFCASSNWHSTLQVLIYLILTVSTAIIPILWYRKWRHQESNNLPMFLCWSPAGSWLCSCTYFTGCFHVGLIMGCLLGPGGEQDTFVMDTSGLPISRSPRCRGVLPVAGYKVVSCVHFCLSREMTRNKMHHQS